MYGPFTQENSPRFYIPDPTTKRQVAGRRPTRRIRNAMDESDAAKIEKRCSQCNNYGHTYKYCPMNEHPDAAEAGPTGNPSDGRRPDVRTATGNVAQARRSVSMRSVGL